MKKIYIVPMTEVECCLAEVMQLPLNSVGQTGHVTGQSDTNWLFESDGDADDTPDAKSGNLWDAWDD